MKKKTKERVEKLKVSLNQKIKKFSANHKVFLFCYPDGTKYNSKRELKSTCYQQHIYLCKSLCQKQCDSFKRKVYLCSEIGCTYYPVCISKPQALMQKFCKSKNLWEERKSLNILYNKYLYLMSIYRGLKIDPVKTLKYLEMKQRKKEEENHGSLSNQKDRKKSKKSKKRKRKKN